MKKAVILAVVIAIACGAGFYLWKTRSAASAAENVGPAAGGPPGEEPVVMVPVQVQKGPMRQVAQATGIVASNLDVDIKCKASGVVTKLPFDISDKVKKDDLIVEVDPIDQVRGVAQAKAALAASEAKLAQSVATVAAGEQTLESDRLRTAAAIKSAEAKAADATAKARREQTLFERKQSSAEEVETAQTTAATAVQDLATAQAEIAALKAEEAQLEVKRQDVKVNQADVDNDKIALDVANQRLIETKVMAPMDGVVSARPIQIGTIIASGITNVGGGSTVVTLSDLSKIYILASVDESDIGSVALGQHAIVTADSFPRTIFTGKVDRIAPKGVNVSNVVTFEVRIEVQSDNKGLLKPQMTTNNEIVIAEKKETLYIPMNAIVRTRKGTFATLVKADDSTEQVAIELGISDGNNIEVIKGLQENDPVMSRAENDSRWRQGSQMNSNRARMMMMRTMGGGHR